MIVVRQHLAKQIRPDAAEFRSRREVKKEIIIFRGLVKACEDGEKVVVG
jgi:hypothetical protein